MDEKILSDVIHDILGSSFHNVLADGEKEDAYPIGQDQKQKKTVQPGFIFGGDHYVKGFFRDLWRTKSSHGAEDA